MATMDQAIATAQNETGRDPLRLLVIDTVPTARHRFHKLKYLETTRAWDSTMRNWVRVTQQQGEVPKEIGNIVPVSLVAARAWATSAP